MGKIFGLVLCMLGMLTACSFSSNSRVAFDSSNPFTFFYQQEEYRILNQVVPSEELVRNEARFLKLEIFGTDTAGEKRSLSLNNLYRLTDGGLAIGVQDAFYRVKRSSQLTSQDEMLDLAQLDSIFLSDEWSLDSKDARVLVWNGLRYRIGEKILAGEEKGEFVASLATVQLFDAKTGVVIPQQEWDEIDWSGQKAAKQDRTYWSYDSVYTLKNRSAQEALLVEINDDYHLAERE